MFRVTKDRIDRGGKVTSGKVVPKVNARIVRKEGSFGEAEVERVYKRKELKRRN